MDSSKIKYNDKGCPKTPIEIKFKDGYQKYDGFSFIENGEDHIYMAVSAKKKNAKGTNKIETKNKNIDMAFGYDVYVEVILDKPLEIAKECNINE